MIKGDVFPLIFDIVRLCAFHLFALLTHSFCVYVFPREVVQNLEHHFGIGFLVRSAGNLSGIFRFPLSPAALRLWRSELRDIEAFYAQFFSCAIWDTLSVVILIGLVFSNNISLSSSSVDDHPVVVHSSIDFCLTEACFLIYPPKT